jgi:hypothetical protein
MNLKMPSIPFDEEELKKIMDTFSEIIHERVIDKLMNLLPEDEKEEILKSVDAGDNKIYQKIFIKYRNTVKDLVTKEVESMKSFMSNLGQ